MSWIPPFFTCGLCGGEIGRWPTTNLLKQQVLLWRHRTVGEGWGEHQAVLGTPAHTPKVSEVPTKKEASLEPLEPPPAPTTPARPALAGDLPASAARFDKKADQNGWTVRAWFMAGPLMDARWKFNRWVKSVVLHAERDGHRLVATWQSSFDPHAEAPDDWKFEGGWSIGHHLEPMSSPELNAALVVPRALCESCDEPPALHISTQTGPVCFNEWKTQREKGA